MDVISSRELICGEGCFCPHDVTFFNIYVLFCDAGGSSVSVDADGWDARRNAGINTDGDGWCFGC